MRLLSLLSLVFSICALSACGSADAPQAGVYAEAAWIRASVPGSKVSAGYLTLHNPGPADDAVIAVDIPGVSQSEVHSMSQVDGMMRMRPVDALSLPAGQTVRLAPGGNHLMLMGVEQAFELGTQRDGQLSLRSGTTLPVRFDIRNQAPETP
jgi:copper(I)-binding protein